MDHLAFQGEADHPSPEVEEVLASSGEVPLFAVHSLLEEAYLVLPVVPQVELPFAPFVMVLLEEVAFPAVVRIDEEHQVAAFVGEVLQTALLARGAPEEPA